MVNMKSEKLLTWLSSETGRAIKTRNLCKLSGLDPIFLSRGRELTPDRLAKLSNGLRLIKSEIEKTLQDE